MGYEKTVEISASMCDKDSVLSVISAFRMVQDAVTAHMGDLGIDGPTLVKNFGAMWVFVRNDLRIFKRPAWRENCKVRCFIASKSPVKLIIDTEIKCANGDRAVMSALELCAIDCENGRIRRTGEFGIDKLETEAALPGAVMLRMPHQEGEVVRSTAVGSTTVDMCGHMNNIEYIRYILDAYPSHAFDYRPITRMHVHYIEQAFEGEIIDIQRCEQGERDLITVSKNGRTITECIIGYGNED